MIKLKLRFPKIPKKTGQLVVASLLGIGLLEGAGSPSPGPGPGPGWTPKWSIGDDLRSTAIPDARWRVIWIDYTVKRYQCEFTFAGATSVIEVDAFQLEATTIYKVN